MKSLLPIFFILTAIGLFFGYLKPSYGEIQAKRAELSSYDDALEQAETLESKTASLQSKVDSLNPDDKAKLEKLLPDTVSNVNLIIDMNTIADNFGMTISNIGFTQAEQDEKSAQATAAAGSNQLYDSIDLTFDISSSYANFIAFISALEESVRLVDITNISFVPPEEGDIYKFTVTVRTYWLK